MIYSPDTKPEDKTPSLRITGSVNIVRVSAYRGKDNTLGDIPPSRYATFTNRLLRLTLMYTSKTSNKF